GKATLDRLADAARAVGGSLLALCAMIPADITGKPRRALEEFARLIARLAERRSALTVPALIDEVCAASGYRDALKAERTAEAEARLENLEELVAAFEAVRDCREVQRHQAGQGDRAGDARGLPRLGRAGRRHRRDRLGVGRRDPDDPAFGQGSRVPGGLPHRPRGGRLPALPVDARARGAGRSTGSVLRG